MLATIFASTSVVAVVASFIVSAIQAREVARQSRINNSIGRTSALIDFNELIQGWYDTLMSRPDLRPYFYDQKVSKPDEECRPQLLIAAEKLADLLEVNLRMAEMMPGVEYFESWHKWPRYMLHQSPVLRELLHAHPDWWPALFMLHPNGVDPTTGKECEPSSGHPLVDPRSGKGVPLQLSNQYGRLSPHKSWRPSRRGVTGAGKVCPLCNDTPDQVEYLVLSDSLLEEPGNSPWAPQPIAGAVAEFGQEEVPAVLEALDDPDNAFAALPGTSPADADDFE